jgi:hypothetical protein
MKFFVCRCLVVLFVAVSAGCGGSLAQPFDQMKSTPITVYRLQNYEPPAAQAAPGQIPGLPPVPPEIQKWLTAGASLLPPNLIPPGLIPGAAPPAAQNVDRLYGFRVLNWMVINDQKQHDEVLDIFGRSGNFEAPRQACMYAEFGFSFGTPPPAAPGAPPPPAVLVSLSCNQVASQSMAWPFGANTGITADTEKRIIAVVQKAFGG